MTRDQLYRLHELMDMILDGWTLKPSYQREYDELTELWNQDQVQSMRRMNAISNLNGVDQ